MTIEKARKVIGLNIHNLDEKMQMAVATIMDAVEKKAAWKPSEEEMEALMLAIEGKCPPTSYMSRRLEDLYEGLVNTYDILENYLNNAGYPNYEQASKDLEEEVEWEWVHREKQEVDLIECAEMDKDEFVRFARHFYELGKQSKEPVNEDLENAAREYATDTFPLSTEEYIDATAQDAFIAGAEWQKEQMLKVAVEGKIEEVSFNNGELHNTIFFSFNEESLRVENRIWFPRCGKDGDKVKIVIIPQKED